MPVATQVCAGASRQRSPGDVAPSRGGTSGGEGLSEQQLVCSLPQTTAGRRTSAGAADATRRAPGSLRRAGEDTLPTPDGRWVPNHTPWRAYTAMLYLNTSGVDYEGGPLRFPELGPEIVPRAGLLVGFPCGQQYQHEVTAVRQGSRYAISMRMTRDPAHAEDWG